MVKLFTINLKIKYRESFRPFAGSILEEDVHEWFDLRGMKSSPTMMYAVNCQPGIEEKIPSIIHVDGTCRIQSVKREQNPLYYDLIKEFHKQTECPIIFNTSFNLGGEALVETIFDAIDTCNRSDINYLYVPEDQTGDIPYELFKPKKDKHDNDANDHGVWESEV